MYFILNVMILTSACLACPSLREQHNASPRSSAPSRKDPKYTTPFPISYLLSLISLTSCLISLTLTSYLFYPHASSPIPHLSSLPPRSTQSRTQPRSTTASPTHFSLHFSSTTRLSTNILFCSNEKNRI